MLARLLLLGLSVALLGTSCCLTDDDNDLNAPGEHNEGTGTNV